MQGAAVIEVENLTKRYGDVEALRGVSFSVNEGEVFGLLGPNGAGKTTTVEILEGLRTPDNGRVSVCGLDPQRSGVEFKYVIGAALQSTALPDKMRAREALDLFGSFYPRRRGTAELLKRFGLEEKRHAFYSQLSGGQKQRLALACALVGEPDLLFLDEPTTGLDPQARRQLWGLIAELQRAGRTILLTTHYMEEAERLCDRVAIMDHGKVIALGTPRELIASIGAGHVVRLSSDGRTLDAAAFSALECVAAARTEDGAVEAQVEHLHDALPALLNELERQGQPLTELRVHSATLEDVFVALTGRRLRDE